MATPPAFSQRQQQPAQDPETNNNSTHHTDSSSVPEGSRSSRKAPRRPLTRSRGFQYMALHSKPGMVRVWGCRLWGEGDDLPGWNYVDMIFKTWLRDFVSQAKPHGLVRITLTEYLFHRTLKSLLRDMKKRTSSVSIGAGPIIRSMGIICENTLRVGRDRLRRRRIL